MGKKLKPEIRKELIIEAAISVAEEVGYLNIQRVDVANKAGCASGTVNRYYGTMNQLKIDVLRHAIKNENYTVIMQGITNNAPQMKKVSDDLKQRACSALINS